MWFRGLSAVFEKSIGQTAHSCWLRRMLCQEWMWTGTNDLLKFCLETLKELYAWRGAPSQIQYRSTHWLYLLAMLHHVTSACCTNLPAVIHDQTSHVQDARHSFSVRTTSCNNRNTCMSIIRPRLALTYDDLCNFTNVDVNMHVMPLGIHRAAPCTLLLCSCSAKTADADRYANSHAAAVYCACNS